VETQTRPRPKLAYGSRKMVLTLGSTTEIAQTIAIMKRPINGLGLLYGDELQRRPEDDATAERRYGITNACRVVLNRADTSLSGREVYAILQREFPDLFRHQEIITPRSSLSSIDW